MRDVGILGIMLLLLSVAAALPATAQDDKTELTVKVLRETDGKPVADAHVVIQFTEERLLRDRRGSWETKTNRRGEVMLPNVPTGTARVQVIARGYQTYGDEHELTKPEEEVTIHLKRPQGQVSAY
jgi:5-hydroxyisourate hydrolase-like protein (transthyretin family)